MLLANAAGSRSFELPCVELLVDDDYPDAIPVERLTVARDVPPSRRSR
jgi:hypothetical protein